MECKIVCYWKFYFCVSWLFKKDILSVFIKKKPLFNVHYKKTFFSFFPFLLSLTYTWYRKYYFWVKFLKWRFAWIDKLWDPLNPKITFLSFDLCVFVCLLSPKLKKKKISNLVFYICILNRWYSNLFIKIGQKLCVQGHTKEF